MGPPRRDVPRDRGAAGVRRRGRLVRPRATSISPRTSTAPRCLAAGAPLSDVTARIAAAVRRRAPRSCPSTDDRSRRGSSASTTRAGRRSISTSRSTGCERRAARPGEGRALRGRRRRPRRRPGCSRRSARPTPSCSAPRTRSCRSARSSRSRGSARPSPPDAARPVGVSGIVGGGPVAGMADKLMPAVGIEVTAAGVAEHYRDVLSAWVVDDAIGRSRRDRGVRAPRRGDRHDHARRRSRGAPSPASPWSSWAHGVTLEVVPVEGLPEVDRRRRSGGARSPSPAARVGCRGRRRGRRHPEGRVEGRGPARARCRARALDRAGDRSRRGAARRPRDRRDAARLRLRERRRRRLERRGGVRSRCCRRTPTGQPRRLRRALGDRARRRPPAGVDHGHLRAPLARGARRRRDRRARGCRRCSTSAAGPTTRVACSRRRWWPLADQVAAAAGVVMGKAARVPAALVRGVAMARRRRATARDLVRAPETTCSGSRPCRRSTPAGRSAVVRPRCGPAIGDRGGGRAPRAPPRRRTTRGPGASSRSTSRRPNAPLLAAIAEAWRADLRGDGTPEDVIERRVARSDAVLGAAPALIVPFVRFHGAHPYPDAGASAVPSARCSCSRAAPRSRTCSSRCTPGRSARAGSARRCSARRRRAPPSAWTRAGTRSAPWRVARCRRAGPRGPALRSTSSDFAALERTLGDEPPQK